MRKKLGPFDSPELQGKPQAFNDPHFLNTVNRALDAQKNRVNNQGPCRKCKDAVQCAFMAFNSFAKNFLNIAQQAQSVTAFRGSLHLTDSSSESLRTAL